MDKFRVILFFFTILIFFSCKDIQDGLWGNLTWDADNWPDPERMTRGRRE